MLFNNRTPYPTQARSNKPPRLPVHAPVLPTPLPCDGRSLVYSGPGRAAGMHVYLDFARSQTVDLCLVRVTSVTATHTFTTALGNPGLAVVCVANKQVPMGTAVGDWLLVGPLTFDADGLARARHAWRPHVPAPRRYSGAVCRIHASGGFGEIASETGNKLFFHVNDLPPGHALGINVLIGQPVSFVEVQSNKGNGWAAKQVHLT